MKYVKNLICYFSMAELVLWCSSSVMIVAAFLLFDRGNHLTLLASLIGVTSLIFNAKGNPFGQLLMVIFSMLYAIISYSFSYYGEMITYLGMSMPMAAAALVSWLRNPYEGDRSQVKVDRLRPGEPIFLCLLTAVVTVIFYFILAAFDTANLLPSTLSVTTSFAAVYLTFRRNPFYAVGYAANDMVLIVLWVLAALDNTTYISVVVCFAAFFANDIYGFISWRNMEQKQAKGL